MSGTVAVRRGAALSALATLVAFAFSALPALAAAADRAGLGEERPAPAAVTSAPPASLPEEVAAAREYFVLARDADRRGDPDGALEWYGRAFRLDAGSRDLCFLYLERLLGSLGNPGFAAAADPEYSVAARVDTVAALGRTCARLAGDGGDVSRDGAAPVPPGVTFAENRLLGAAAAGAGDTAFAFRHFRAALAAAGPADETGDILIALAGLYEEAGDWAGHARVLERLLPRLGYPARLVERLARVYARLDRPDDFLPVLRAAWDRTGNPSYAVTLAALYEARGLPLSLLAVAQDLAARNPEPEYRELLARAYASASRPDSALAITGALLEAVDAGRAPRSPDDGAREAVASIRYLHGSLSFERGRYREAIRAADKLLDGRDAPDATDGPGGPPRAAVLYLKGSATLERGRRSSTLRVARKALDEALRLAPASPDYRARRAYLEYVATAASSSPDSVPVDSLLRPVLPPVTGLPDSVAAARRLMLEGWGHARLAANLSPRWAWERPAVFSDTAAARHHRERALARFEAVLSAYPEHPAALFEAGALRERLGDREGAKTLMRRLIARDSTHALAMNYLAYTLIERGGEYDGERDRAPGGARVDIPPGDLEEAGRLLERALALEPENGAYRDSRGWWYYRRGQPGDLDSARAWLIAADESMPGDPEVLGHLVQVLYTAGRREEACAVWQRLLRRDPATRLFLHCPAAEAGMRP